VSAPEFKPDEEVEGVGAMPRISDMWAADFEDMFLAAIARARCL